MLLASSVFRGHLLAYLASKLLHVAADGRNPKIRPSKRTSCPYDEEVRDVVTGFGNLLREIVETIDRWGLKNHFLRKHRTDVERFYRRIFKRDYKSDAARKCKDRFEKNQNNLFTFLEHDGVPWNNNNAEHAIKAFARLRRGVEGMSTPMHRGIPDSPERLPNVQIHRRGLSGLPPFRGKGHSRLRGKPAQAQEAAAHQRHASSILSLRPRASAACSKSWWIPNRNPA